MLDEVEYCIVRKAGKLAADEIKTLPKGTIPMEVRMQVQCMYVHVQYAFKKKRVRSCVQSRVAAVHINSRVNIAYAHAR